MRPFVLQICADLDELYKAVAFPNNKVNLLLLDVLPLKNNYLTRKLPLPELDCNKILVQPPTVFRDPECLCCNRHADGSPSALLKIQACGHGMNESV